jgi:hypothetical protein
MSIDYCQLSVARTRKGDQFSHIAIFRAESHFDEVSPFLKSFRFGGAIPRDYCSQSTKNWHGV